jgi:hypothetical protein
VLRRRSLYILYMLHNNRQCTYNVTPRSVHVTIFAVEKKVGVQNYEKFADVFQEYTFTTENWKVTIVKTQDRQCTYNVTKRRVRESLLQWKSNKYYIFACVCACLCVVRACMWVPGRVCVCMRISACSLANPACNAYAPYCDVIRGLPLEFTIFFWIIS